MTPPGIKRRQHNRRQAGATRAADPGAASQRDGRRVMRTGSPPSPPESDLLDHVRETLVEERLVPCGAALVVGVSGGADSMVLLHLLSKLAPEQKWRLVVAHYNHKLRGKESDMDEALVAKEARKLGLMFERGEGEVKPYARAHRVSIEMAARELRHRFLARIARKHAASRIVLAHHADDQVETVILRLLRGSGPEGLRGMRAVVLCEFDRKLQLVRPLLGVRRRTLAEYARRHGIAFRNDSSNAATDFARNWVRRRLLPLIERRLQPAFSRAVLRVADLVGAEADFVTDTAREWLNKATRKRFEKLHPAVQRRVIQLQLRELGVGERYELVESLRRAADVPVTASPEVRVWRDARGRLQIDSGPKRRFGGTRAKLDLSSGQGKTIFDGMVVEWRVVPAGAVPPGLTRDRQSEYFDADRVGTEAVLRHWEAGDRLRPIGMQQAVKLQDIFVNKKIPREERHRRLVAESAQHGIFWVEGLRIGEGFKVSKDTRRVLEWRWGNQGTGSRDC